MAKQAFYSNAKTIAILPSAASLVLCHTPQEMATLDLQQEAELALPWEHGSAKEPAALVRRAAICELPAPPAARRAHPAGPSRWPAGAAAAAAAAVCCVSRSPRLVVACCYRWRLRGPAWWPSAG